MNSIYKIVVGLILGAFVRKSLDKLTGQAPDRSDLHELVERKWIEREIQVEVTPRRGLPDLEQFNLRPEPGPRGCTR